jgi:hypothetical protein
MRRSIVASALTIAFLTSTAANAAGAMGSAPAAGVRVGPGASPGMPTPGVAPNTNLNGSPIVSPNGSPATPNSGTTAVTPSISSPSGVAQMNGNMGTSGALGNSNGAPANTSPAPSTSPSPSSGDNGLSQGGLDITKNGLCPNGTSSC